MIKDTEYKLVSLELYKLLLKKEKKYTSGEKISSKVYTIISEYAPLLERIPENMPEFTLHDPNHGAKVANIMSKIIPAKVLDNLNHIEISLLLLSAYLHDIGMTCSVEEKEEIIKNSAEFRILFRSDIINFHSYQSFIDNGEHRQATFVQDQVFTEFLRLNHVKRSALFIREHLSKGDNNLEYNGISFFEHLISICNAHGEPVKSLKDINKWPRNTLIGETIVDIQFLSLILRLADILDLDAERTPKLIYEYINPKNPVSILEWKKHRSVVGRSITPEKVLFEAVCTSPEVERALKEFLRWIETERKETIALLKKYNDDVSKKHYLELYEEILSDRIKNDGTYIYNDLKFSVDYKRVIELLIGERLYKNPVVAIRELIQNSVDAIKIREQIYNTRAEFFRPTIKLTLEENTLVIEDNGLGMDHFVFQNYFLQAGKSYYSSKDFYAKFSNLDIVSEFGIGILSVFMIASSLKIESRKEPEDPLSPPHPIYFEIPTAYSYTIERESNRPDIGTKLTLTLKDYSLLNQYDLVNIVKEIIPISPYEIIISIKDKNELIYKVAEQINYKKLPLIVDKTLRNLPSIRRRTGDKDKTFEWLKLSFVDSSDPLLKEIEGSISIINRTGKEAIVGKICQRSFAIGYPAITDEKFEIKIPESLNNLFPSWICLDIQINITNSSCLNLSPDRTEVLVDEKFKDLKKRIEKEIIHRITLRFSEDKKVIGDENFINFHEYLFNGDYFNFEYNNRDIPLTSEGQEFLSSNILFRCLSPNGLRTFKTIKELKKLKNIGVVSDQWTNINFVESLAFLQKHNVHLILFSEALVWTNELQNAFYKIFIGKNYYDLNFKIIVNDLLPSYNFLLITNDISELKTIKNQFVFLDEYGRDFILLLNEGSFDISIDKYNKIFASLPLGPENKEYIQFFSALEGDIAQKLRESIELVSNNNVTIQKDVISNLTRTYYMNFYPAFKNIFNIDKTLLENLNNSLWVFFGELTEEGLLQEDHEFPEFTLKNFPKYWSNE